MSGIYLDFIFARCAGCGYPIKHAADARQHGNGYLCPPCYERERRRPFVQLSMFDETDERTFNNGRGGPFPDAF